MTTTGVSTAAQTGQTGSQTSAPQAEQFANTVAAGTPAPEPRPATPVVAPGRGSVTQSAAASQPAQAPVPANSNQPSGNEVLLARADTGSTGAPNNAALLSNPDGVQIAQASSSGNAGKISPGQFIRGASGYALGVTAGQPGGGVAFGRFIITPWNAAPWDGKSTVFEFNGAVIPGTRLPSQLQLPGLGGVTVGQVATYHPDGRTELGAGGSAVFAIPTPGGTQRVSVFLNFRGAAPQNGRLGDGRYSVNGGFLVNANGLAGAGTSIVGAGTGNPALVAAGRAIADFPIAGQAGVAFRGEVVVKNGQIQQLFDENGREVDLSRPQNLLDFAQKKIREKPIVIPNRGDSAIARFNYDNQIAYGTSPWQLARTSGGKNHGQPVVAIANSWNSAIRTYGQMAGYRTGIDRVRLEKIFTNGPSNNEEARSAAIYILRRGNLSEQQKNNFITQLANNYGIDLGVREVKERNQLISAYQNQPGDRAYVRGAFQGEYRFGGDLGR